MVRSNDSGVAVAEALGTTHANAELLMDGSTSGDPSYATSPVWLIQLRGQFVCGMCAGPPGAKAPTGALMSAIVSADTFADTDFGIDATVALDLAPLGPVVSLLDPGVLTELRAAAASSVAAHGGGRYVAEAVLVARDKAPVLAGQPGRTEGVGVGVAVAATRKIHLCERLLRIAGRHQTRGTNHHRDAQHRYVRGRRVQPGPDIPGGAGFFGSRPGGGRLIVIESHWLRRCYRQVGPARSRALRSQA
jgi:hypothetical protein